MYTPNYQNRGILPVLSGRAVLRNNDVSTFALDVDGADPLSKRFKHGWRVVIEDEMVQLCCGAVNSIASSYKSGVHDLTLSGATDMHFLRDMITLPNPSNAADNQSQDAYYKAKGNAGELIYDLVRQHVGQDARAEFKRNLIVYPLQPGTFSKSSSLNSRFKTVLEEVQALALQAGLVIRFTQDDGTQRTLMNIAKGRDFSRAVRLTEINGGLTDWSMSEDAPTVTSVLVAGQGEGTARTLKVVDGNENDWDFKALRYQDRRDTNDINELVQAGEQTLEENREKAGISLEIGETDRLRFGRDFWLGDTITVQLSNGATVTDIVQVADIDWSAQGRKVKLTIGPVIDEQDAPRWVPLVRQLQSQVRALENR